MLESEAPRRDNQSALSIREKGPLALFYERMYLVLTVTGVAAACAWWISEDLTPIYRSQARCYLPQQTDALSLTTEEGNLPSLPKLPTASDPLHQAMLGTLQAEDLLETVATRVPERDRVQIRASVDFAIDAFNNLVITAYDVVPVTARDIAGEYLRAFRDKLDASTKERVRENLASLDEEIGRGVTEVDVMTSERIALLEGRGTIDFDAQYRELLARATSLRTQLDQLDVDLEVQRRRRVALEEIITLRPEISLTGYTEVVNPRIASIEEEITRAQAERSRLLATYREAHPEVEAQQRLLEILELQLADQRAEPTVENQRSFSPDALRAEFTRSLADLDLTVAGLEGRRLRLQEQYDAAEAEMGGMPRFQAELDDVETRLRKARENLSNLRDRRNELQFYLARRPSFLVTSELPVVPTEPHLPRTALNAAVAGALGLVISLLLVVLRTRLAAQREAALW